MADEQNVPLVYANNVRLAISFSDFRLFFGEANLANMPAMNPGHPVAVPFAPAIDRVSIAISPDLIPQVIDGLKRGLEVYTAQFGALRAIPQQPQPVATTPST